ncbi:DNA adenine methylase [Paenibacillus agilis]|uniref:site-specific DNA-methyltransferase (adenine-specific) n=1 Tax=Paenibacillus agilis TaxID=3020863 RepID=A0A559ID17_9BACL|nr:DNA adenine methylase [Paenibacillus agilis]TVX85567.1 DNA adenine methylase [Paenibacillus agilis]
MSIPRILHYPGAKWSMANWILGNMPEHTIYLEPYFGSGALLFSKRRSSIETVNDLDGDVTNLFEIVRTSPEQLAYAVYWTPYSREEYYKAYEPTDDRFEKARRFLVRTWQAIGAKTSDRTGWRSNIKTDKSPNKMAAGQWRDLPEKLIKVADRLKGVQIENKPALALMERYNQKDCLIYCDPPYILSTRNKRIYKYEMTEEDHEELLEMLDAHLGPVLLSGYAHSLYDERLKHWKRETKRVKAEAGAFREEVLWINPLAAARVGQISMNL